MHIASSYHALIFFYPASTSPLSLLHIGTFSSPMVFTCTWLLTIPFPVVVSLLFAYFRPYTNNIFNIIDSAVFASLALEIYIITYAMSGKPFPIQLFFLMAIIPVLYYLSCTKSSLAWHCFKPVVAGLEDGSKQEMKTSTCTLREVTTMKRGFRIGLWILTCTNHFFHQQTVETNILKVTINQRLV